MGLVVRLRWNSRARRGLGLAPVGFGWGCFRGLRWVWLRCGGRDFVGFWVGFGFGLRPGGVDLLGDVGGGVEAGGWPEKGVEAAELLELAIAGGDGPFDGGDIEPEAGEASAGAGGGLVGSGEGYGPGAVGEDVVLDFVGDGLELLRDVSARRGRRDQPGDHERVDDASG